MKWPVATPIAIAKNIQTVRYRSRNDNRPRGQACIAGDGFMFGTFRLQ